MVAEAAELQRVERDAQPGRRARGDGAHDHPGVRGDGARARRQGGGLEGGERALPRPRRVEQRGQQGAEARLGRALGDGRRVLAVERALEPFAGRGGHAGLLQQRRGEARQGHVEDERAHAHRRQRLGRDQRNLRVRLRGGAAHQLDPGLGKLPRGRPLAAPHPQHLPRVAQPQGAGLPAEAGRRDARDLRRGVGAQPHHALAHRVHEAKGLLGDGRARAGEQPLLELEERRLHALVAVAREGLHHRLDQRGLALRLGGEEVHEAGGEQRAGREGDRGGGVVHHGASVWRGTRVGATRAGSCVGRPLKNWRRRMAG